MLQLPVYMDGHATTPCDPQVVEAMMPYFGQLYGNASSKGYMQGWQAAEAVQIAREEVAALIKAEASEVIFTSGATESINLALKGAYETYCKKGKHIITVSSEHQAVLDTCKHLEKMGAEISRLPILPDGLMDLSLLKSAIRADTILIAVMYANNETGVIQPIKEIGEIAKEKGILFFTDASQAIGKIPSDVISDGIDLLACSAHKMYGPKGVGALYVRRKNPRVKLAAQVNGGGQEKGLRSGTLNVPGIVGFGKAAALASREMESNMRSIARLRNRLEYGLMKMKGTRLNGNQLNRLPTVCNISFSGISGNRLLEMLIKDVAVASGSACASESPQPSHVLKAMGLNDEEAYHAIRFSLTKYNTEEEIDFVIESVGKTLEGIKVSEKIGTLR